MSVLKMVPDRDVVVIVDVQNDFCPGGRLAVPDGDEVVAPINMLMGAFVHVVLTQDWHPPGHSSFASAHAGREPYETIKLAYGSQVLWPDHCVQGSEGAQFHEGLDTARAELVLRKGFRPQVDSYSAFFENDRVTPTGLAGYLKERGFRRVVLAGLAYDFCVLWSAEDARQVGFEVVVAADACRALDVAGSRAQADRRLAKAGVAVVSALDIVPA